MKRRCKFSYWALCLGLSWFNLQGGNLEVAKAALQDELYQVAEKQAMSLLLEGEHTTMAFLVLVQALQAQGHYPEILKQVAEVDAKVQADLPDGALRFWQALALFEMGQTSEAASLAAADGPAQAPYDMALQRLAARAHYASGNFDGAWRVFAHIERAAPQAKLGAANAWEWALGLYRQKRAQEALEVLDRLVTYKDVPAAVANGRLLKGQILLESGQLSEATNLLWQVVGSARVPEATQVHAWLELSFCALQEQQTNAALKHAHAAYEAADLPDYRRLAGFYLGDLLCADVATIDEAVQFVKPLVREFATTPAAMHGQLKLADALLRAKRAEHAAAEYKIFLETYASSDLDLDVLQGRGWALMQLGHYAEASAIFKRAAGVATNTAVQVECLFKQGEAWVADERYAEAAKVFDQIATQFDDADTVTRALLQSADALIRSDLSAAAIAVYQKLIEGYPQHARVPQARLSLGKLYAQARNSEAAIAVFTQLLEQGGDQALRVLAHLERGKVYYRDYNFEPAMHDFATVVETAPELRDEARFLMTLSLYGLGRDQEARMAATAFLLDFPESDNLPDMILWLGKLDFNRGRYESAKRFFLDYLTRWPQAEWAAAAGVWAARAMFAENDFKGAVEAISRVLRAYPESPRVPEALVVQAEALIELARFDEAVLLLEQVLTQHPQSAWRMVASRRKGDALFAMGAGNHERYREALEAFEQALGEEHLTPSQRLSLNFKRARCLEKLKEMQAAIDCYYSEIIMRYLEERAGGTWFDERSSGLFLRATFSVAEMFEHQGKIQQALHVLQRAVQAGIPGSAEAQQRATRLQKLGRGSET